MEITIWVEEIEEDGGDEKKVSYRVKAPSFDIAEEKLGAIRRKVEGTNV